MVNNFISSSVIISRILSNYNPTSRGWIPYVYIWIADVIRKVGVPMQFKDDCKTLTIVDGKTYIDFSLEAIDYIEYNGTWLPTTNSLDIHGCKCTLPVNTEYKYKQDGNFIKVNFDSGIIKIHFQSILVDSKDKLPMIPSNVEFLDACVHYIMVMMLQRGELHQTVSYKEMKDELKTLIQAARNELNRPDMDNEIEFQLSWLNRHIHSYTAIVNQLVN